MHVLRGNFLRLVLLGLVVLVSRGAQTENVSEKLPAQSVASSAEVDEFYHSLEVEARKFYDVHKEAMPHLKRGMWDRLVRQSVFQMKQVGFNMKSLARYAKPAAGTFVVTNIVSTFILPPVLTAAGFPGLAMLVLATPFEPFVAAGQVFVMRQMDDFRLLREIGIKDFRAVKALRKDLLGMPERAHILSVVESELLEEIKKSGGPDWINISSKKVDEMNTIAIKELEQIVRMDPDGEKWLDNLTPHKLSKQLYALEQWFYIQERDELRQKLVKHFEGRVEIDPLSKQFHELIDLRRSLREAEERLADVIKKSRSGLSSKEKKALKSLTQDISDHVNETIKAVDLAETHLLLSRVSKSSQVLIPDLTTAKKLLRERIKTFHMAAVLAAGLPDDRLVTAESLRKTVSLGPVVAELPLDCIKYFEKL